MVGLAVVSRYVLIHDGDCDASRAQTRAGGARGGAARAVLRWPRSTSMLRGVVLRANVVLASIEGRTKKGADAKRLAIPLPTVGKGGTASWNWACRGGTTTR